MKKQRLLVLMLMVVLLVACTQTTPSPVPTAQQAPQAVAQAMRPQAWIDAPLDGAILPLAPYQVVFHVADARMIASFELSMNGEVVQSLTNTDANRHLIEGNYFWKPTAAGVYRLQLHLLNGDGERGETAVSITIQADNTPTPVPSATATIIPSPTDTTTPLPSPTATPLPPTFTPLPPTFTPTFTPLPPTLTQTPTPTFTPLPPTVTPTLIPIITIPPTTDPNPHPISPKDEAVFCDSDVTLLWSAGAGGAYDWIVEYDTGGGVYAERYRDTAEGNSVVIYTNAPFCGMTYRWRVRRLGMILPGPWSENAYFTVGPGGPR